MRNRIGILRYAYIYFLDDSDLIIITMTAYQDGGGGLGGSPIMGTTDAKAIAMIRFPYLAYKKPSAKKHMCHIFLFCALGLLGFGMGKILCMGTGC